MKINYYSERLLYEFLSVCRCLNQKKIFIHIPKCAGMSIRRSLQLSGRILPVSTDRLKSKEYSKALISKMNQIGDHHGSEHARLRDVRTDLREKHDAFAIIRNPWDRVASRYYFAKQVIEKERKYSEDKHDISSFEAFLEERHTWGNEQFMWHRAIRGWYPCYDYLINEEGKVDVDVLSFEKLDENICEYFKLKKPSRKRNVTSVRNLPIEKLYTQKTIDIVADWYKKDIDFFGYDFGTGPTQNTLYNI